MADFFFPHDIFIQKMKTVGGKLPEIDGTPVAFNCDIQPFSPSSGSPEFGNEAINRVRVFCPVVERSKIEPGHRIDWQGDTYAFETEAATNNDNFGLGYCEAVAVRI